jgi:hypothetical protein
MNDESKNILASKTLGTDDHEKIGKGALSMLGGLLVLYGAWVKAQGKD